MIKHFTALIAIFTSSCLLLSLTVFYTNSIEIKTLAKSDKSSISSTNSTKLTTKNKKVKIINDEIDYEFDIKMNEKQEREYNKCKKQIKDIRRPRNKNKPTPCSKVPTEVNDHITNQDYNILWENVNQQTETNKGLDMNKELPISNWIDVVESSCNESSNSSVSSQNSSLANSTSNSSLISSQSSESCSSSSNSNSSIVSYSLSSNSSSSTSIISNNSLTQNSSFSSSLSTSSSSRLSSSSQSSSISNISINQSSVSSNISSNIITSLFKGLD